MLSSEGNRRSFRQNVTLAVLLAGVAGAVNAEGFFILSVHTSHMTGRVAVMGQALAAGDYANFLFAAAAVTAFFFGAATAALLVDFSQHWTRARYTLALALETVVIVAVAFASRRDDVSRTALVCGIAFAMGLQNALVTRISGAIIRTTHLTGVITDLGMEAARVARWVLRGGVFLHARQHGWAVWRAPELEKAWMHFALIASFLGSAGVGSWVLLHTDRTALALPTAVLIGLIGLDLRKRPETLQRGQPRA